MRIRLPAALRDAADTVAQDATSGELSRESKAVAYARAQLAFGTDPDRKPVEAFYHLVQDHVALDTYRRHAVNHRWEEDRSLFHARIRRAFAEQLQHRIVRDRLDELAELQLVRKHLLVTATPRSDPDENGDLDWKVEPKSLGEVVRSLRDMQLLLEHIRREVLVELDAVAPGAEAGAGPSTQRRFSAAESAALARQLLVMRGVDEGEGEDEDGEALDDGNGEEQET